MANLIFIISDALRYDSFEKLLNLGLLPNFKKIIEKSIFFENVFSTTNTTDPSLTSIFSGLHPLQHKIINHGHKVSEEEIKSAHFINTIPKILLSKKYYTVAIDFLERWHKNGYKIYASKLNFLNNNFYKYLNLIYYHTKIINVDNVKGILSNYKKFHDITLPSIWQNPFFTTDLSLCYLNYLNKPKINSLFFIHYWCSHSPYLSGKEEKCLIKKNIRNIGNIHCEDRSINFLTSNIHNEKWVNSLTQWFNLFNIKHIYDAIASYYSSILLLDKQIGRIIKWIEDNGKKDTYIIFTSDHGESLGEHDIYFDHHGLYNTNLKIPFFIYPSDKSIKIPYRVSHIDIMSYIINKIQNDKLMFLGEEISNYFNTNKNLIFIENFTQKKIGFIYHDWKLILPISEKHLICEYCGKIHGGNIELFNIKSDKNEKHNLAIGHSDIIDDIKKNFKQEILKFKFLNLKYQPRKL